jgi:carboxyl-terminal processing protease
MGTTKVVMLLRDKIGTFVSLTILRDGQPIKFKIKREKIVIRPVDYSIRETASGKVGYIRLKQFSADAASEMKKAISTLERSGVVGYILDLRSNPGGLLYSAVDIARMWLDDGKIVSILNRQVTGEVQSANRTAITKKPLVILVDGGSASASEILAGALQDNQRAKIVGTRTFRNGTIQSLLPLPGDAALSMTIAKCYTPKGNDINRRGIEPDVVAKLKKSDIQMLVKDRNLIATLADPQYKQAIEELLQLVK